MNRKAEFFSYVIPSVFAFALSGVYAIVDGFFIGNSIGDVGLAAINIAYPVTALLQALGTGIGMGGAVQYSIHRGKSQNGNPQDYFNTTILLLFSICLLTMVLLTLTIQPILSAFGARGELLSMGQEYLRIIVLGAVFQIFSTGFVPLIRNMGSSIVAMYAMIGGFLTNILFDYLLVWVFPYGLAGAAAATIIGQGVTMAVCVCYFIKVRTGFSLPDLSVVRTAAINILRIAISPFGLTFSPNIILILMNKFAMIYGGEDAVACYAAIAYITMIIVLLLQGVGDGCQPLISRYYGQKEFAEVRETKRLAYVTAGLIAIICMILLFAVRYDAAALFGASNTVQREVAGILPYFIAGFLFLAFVRVTTSGFYATEKNNFAYILVYAEPVMLFLFLLIVPRFWGITGIWVAAPLSQIITAIIALAAKKYDALKSPLPNMYDLPI